jgi:hypothetical protein
VVFLDALNQFVPGDGILQTVSGPRLPVSLVRTSLRMGHQVQLVQNILVFLHVTLYFIDCGQGFILRLMASIFFIVSEE